MWRCPLFGMSLKSISNCQWKSNVPVALEDESEMGGHSALSPSLDTSARPPLLLLYPRFRHLCHLEEASWPWGAHVMKQPAKTESRGVVKGDLQPWENNK